MRHSSGCRSVGVAASESATVILESYIEHMSRNRANLSVDLTNNERSFSYQQVGRIKLVTLNTCQSHVLLD